MGDDVMPARHQIWRSRLWSKRGDERVIIHIIAERDATRFQVVVAKRNRPAIIVVSGPEKNLRVARYKAEHVAARIAAMRSTPDESDNIIPFRE